MNTFTNAQLESLAVATVIFLFAAFFILLVWGMISMSITMIVSSFVCGFIGVAITQHNSDNTEEHI